jgi:putative ATPase
VWVLKLIWLVRHPVHNTYLPIQFEGDKFLKEENDASGKVWNEDALRRWETEVNGGRQWEGRKENVEE